MNALPRPSNWRRYLRFWRPDIESDVDEELRFHLESRTEELIAAGVPEAAANSQAVAELGNLDQLRRQLAGIDRRLQKRRSAIEGWWVFASEVRRALRGLRRRPGFAAAVILTIALGIGANTAIFSTVGRLLLSPPPMLRQPALTHRIYVVRSDPELAGVYIEAVPYTALNELTAVTHSFARTALYMEPVVAVGEGADAREMPVAAVSATFFGFFDALPPLGRYFGAQEDLPPRGTPVAVLSYGTWQTRFGGRSDVLGAPLRIGSILYTVIGVAPKGFVGIWPEEAPAAFIPISSYTAALPFWDSAHPWWTSRASFAGLLVGRKPGVTVSGAEMDLDELFRRDWGNRRGLAPPRAIVGSALTERGPAHTSFARVSELVGGMAIIVLLIAGANVANLLLARFLSRRSEIAVRLALGAKRGRLLSEILTESVLLAALGGLAGLGIAQAGGSMLQSALLPLGAQPSSIIGDPHILIFASFATLAVGVLTGLLPGAEAVRVDPIRYLTAARHGEARRVSWARGTLLLIQGGLSVVLLVGAGLFVRSLINVRHTRLGYDPARVLAVYTNMRGDTLDSAQGAALRQRLLATAQHVPDVEHAALNLSLPFRGRALDNFRVPGVDSAAQAFFYRFLMDAVSPDYFATMGTRIIRGRGIQRGDVAGAPGAVVVSQAIANVVWPGKDPIGQCVMVGWQPKGCTYVVGVAEDIKYTQLSDDPGFFYYLSAPQYSVPEMLGLLVRVRGQPSHERDVIRRALQREMPGDSYVTVTPLADIIAEQMHAWQLGATMFSIFGLLALSLAAIGLYGVIAYTVTRRTREIGIRITLGARAGSVLWLGVRQGLLVAALGTVIGAGIALAFSRFIAPLLFNESPRDPLVYASVVAVILAVAGVASILPARRAARLDPNVTLRTE